MKWWRKLTDQQRINHLKNKDTDLHNPRRKELRDIMDPDISPPPVADKQTQIRLPQSIRKQYWKEFLKGDLEDREALVAKLVKTHIELKNAFLECPADAQKKYQDEFVNANFDQRKTLLKKIQKETGQEVLRKKEKPENENGRLDKSYQNKIDTMTSAKPIPTLSKGTGKVYAIWFKGLSLEEKRTMIHHSELDSRLDPATGKNLRVVVRDRFLKLPPDVQLKHKKQFLEVDVDRRIQMLDNLEHPEKSSENKGEKIEYTPDQIRAAIEEAKHEPSVQQSLLVTNLIDLKFEQHKRAREKLGISDAAKSELVMKKADEKGMKKHETDLETRKTMAMSDKRVIRDRNETAFSAVEKMRQERIKMAQQNEDTEAKEQLKNSAGEDLVENLNQVDDVDADTEKFAQDTQFENLHVNTLAMKRDARNVVRRDIVNNEEGWSNHNVRRADIKFWNEAGDKELSEAEFDTQVRQHQHAETRAKLLPFILKSLPGASTDSIEAALENTDATHVDFRKIAA